MVGIAAEAIFSGTTSAQRTATATPTVVNGFLVAITLTDSGAGYSNPPTVTISGGGGTGATASATIINGAVEKIIVNNAGIGYTNAPSVLVAAPPSPKPPFSDGLIGYYPFNGNAQDLSGNAYDGTVVGARLAPDRLGTPDSAYRFFGSSDHIVIPVDFKNSQKVTISTWIEFHTQTKGKAIFNKMGAFHGINFGYRLDGTIEFYVGGTAGEARAVYQTVLPTNSWHFLAGTYNGQTVKIFFDGILVASKDFSGNITYTETFPSWIGDYSPGPSFPLEGTMDDLRFYNRALSDQEVRDLYHYEAPESRPSLRVEVETVRVTLLVTPARRYQLESSFDLKVWTKVGEPIFAGSSEIPLTLNALAAGQYFRLYQVL
jgi:hypothetical protein